VTKSEATEKVALTPDPYERAALAESPLVSVDTPEEIEVA
jgi:hypothetical protein